MSIDLELRLPIIRIENSPEISKGMISKSCAKNKEEEGCRTPRSPQHRIPAVVTCPPAPKKQRRSVDCKRKLEFFEALRGEEVESLFGTVGEVSFSKFNASNKRKLELWIRNEIQNQRKNHSFQIDFVNRIILYTTPKIVGFTLAFPFIYSWDLVPEPDRCYAYIAEKSDFISSSEEVIIIWITLYTTAVVSLSDQNSFSFMDV